MRPSRLSRRTGPYLAQHVQHVHSTAQARLGANVAGRSSSAAASLRGAMRAATGHTPNASRELLFGPRPAGRPDSRPDRRRHKLVGTLGYLAEKESGSSGSIAGSIAGQSHQGKFKNKDRRTIPWPDDAKKRAGPGRCH